MFDVKVGVLISPQRMISPAEFQHQQLIVFISQPATAVICSHSMLMFSSKNPAKPTTHFLPSTKW